MDRNKFKGLVNAFLEEKDFNKKVEILLSYDLRTLTNPQIEKILDTLSEDENKKLMDAISKKTGGI